MTDEPDIIREAERILREAREPQGSPLAGLVNPEHGETYRIYINGQYAGEAMNLHITYDGTQEDHGDVSG